AHGPVVAATHPRPGDADDTAKHDQPQGRGAAGPGKSTQQARPVGGGSGHTAGKEDARQGLVKAIFSPCPTSAMPGASACPGTSASAAPSRCSSGRPSGAGSSG